MTNSLYNTLAAVRKKMTSPGEMFEVSTAEVEGQTLNCWKNAPATLRQVWEMAALHGDNDYLIFGEERWTYAQANAQVASLARWLTDNGIGHGDGVALAMRNYPEYMLAYWAVVSIGATVIGVNAWWVEEELRYCLEDSTPKVLIADTERLTRFDAIAADFPRISVIAVRCEESLPAYATPWETVMAAPSEMPAANISPEDVACIFYTSGTTGFPKGAQLTHRGCTNNILTVMFINLSQATAGAMAEGKEPPNPLDPDAPKLATLITTPLFHVTGNNCSAHVTTALGGKIALMYKWNALEALKIIANEKINSMTGVPVMARELMTHPEVSQYDISSLAAVATGGAPVPPDTIELIDDNSDSSASQGYGMTETCGLITGSNGVFFAGKPTSTGSVIPVYEVKCIDANGEAVAQGEVGELCLRGAQVIKGYLNRPEATAESIVDGWLHTGDIAFIDEDNYIFLVDRAKDMVLRGGENVYCTEVENVIFRHDKIAEVAVFAVPDERLGEEVGAAIFPSEGQTLSKDEVTAFCKEHMAPYKVPRHIWIMDEPLPRNASGKFVKPALKEMLLGA